MVTLSVPLGCVANGDLNAVNWLAQLVEHWATVREVLGSKPQLVQHSGSLNN